MRQLHVVSIDFCFGCGFGCRSMAKCIQTHVAKFARNYAKTDKYGRMAIILSIETP